MKASDLTQSELARRIGVTQGAIAKIASNNPNGSSFLHKLARELRTTPEYLTGETDDPDAGASAEVPLNYYQRDLLECVAMLTPGDQKALLHIARSMAGVADPKNFTGFSGAVLTERASRENNRPKERGGA